MVVSSINVMAYLVLLSLPHSLAASDPKQPLGNGQRFELPFIDEGTAATDGWVGISPEGTALAAYYTVNGKVHIAVWDTTSKKLITKLEIGKGQVATRHGVPAAFTSSGSHLAYLIPGEVRLLPLLHGEKAQSIAVPRREPIEEYGYISLSSIEDTELCQAMYSPESGTYWVDCCQRGTTPKRVVSDRFRFPRALGSVLSPDRKRIAWIPSGDILNPTEQSCAVNIVDSKSKATTSLLKDGAECTALAFSPSGKALASGSSDSSLTVWNLEQSVASYTVSLPKRGWSVRAVAWSPDENLLAYGTNARKGLPNVIIVSGRTRKIRWMWADNDSGVLHVSWNSKGTQLAVIGAQTVSLYCIGDGKK